MDLFSVIAPKLMDLLFLGLILHFFVYAVINKPPLALSPFSVLKFSQVLHIPYNIAQCQFPHIDIMKCHAQVG